MIQVHHCVCKISPADKMDIHPSRRRYNLNVLVKRGTTNPADIYLLKVNNKNTRTRCETCSKLTIKAPRSGVFIVNFKHIPHLVLVFILLTWSR